MLWEPALPAICLFLKIKKIAGKAGSHTPTPPPAKPDSYNLPCHLPAYTPGTNEQTVPMTIHGHGTGARFTSGLTLLELMVTLSIAAILLTTGVPAFQGFVMKQRMKAAINNLHNDLLAARAQAIHRSSFVVACPGHPDSGCRDNSDWSNGWIVFEDDNRDRQHQEKENLVRHGPEQAQIVIRSPANRKDVRFFPDGSTPGSNASIGLSGSDGPSGARKLVISNIGRIRRDHFETIDPGSCPA